jgi:hypothetical protein
MLATYFEKAGSDWIFEQLKKKFKDTTTIRGSKQSFLGQAFDFGVKGESSVTMDGYTADLLEMRNTMKIVSTPALEDLIIMV